MPKISVIVPVYKVEKYINRCIDSILAQSFDDFELILVDDGSPDNCGQICEEYATKDARVHVLHRKNGGLSAARNTGIDWVFKHSDSEWLTFIDSDDWVHSRYLETLYQAVLIHQVPVSSCGFQETSGENPAVKIEGVNAIKYCTEKYYLEYNANATVAWGKLYQKSCFEKIRYPVGRIHEDEYVTYHILFSFPEIAVIEQPLYAYYVNSEGITKSAWNPKRLDALPAFESQINFFKKRKMQSIVEKRIQIYLWSIEWQLEAVKNSEYMQSKYEQILRRKLGKFLLKWKKRYPFKKNVTRYETAFPKAMWLYWTVQGIKSKFTRRK